MYKSIAVAIAFVLTATVAHAGGRDGYSNNSNKNFNVNKSFSASQASSSSSANNSGNNQNVNFRDRRQAPGIGAGGGDCTIYGGLSFPGGGFVLGGPAAHCRNTANAQMADTYLGRAAAAQYVCSQPAFRKLSACVGTVKPNYKKK